MSDSSAAFRTVVLLTVALGLGTPAARADSDYDRGYRDGYGKGYQDGYNAREATASPPPRSRPDVVPGIFVVRAWYGDRHRSCDSTAWASRNFNNRMSASAEVNNSSCGDPAPGRRKMLIVEYTCGDGPLRTAEAFQHRRIWLDCN